MRWGPCITAAGSAACRARQSAVVNYIAPLRPHESLLGPAILAGAGLLLVGGSLLMVLARVRVSRSLTRLTLVILMAKPLLFGVLTLIGPATGGLGRHRGWLIGEIILDIAVAVILLLTPNDRPEDYRRLLLCAVPVWMVGWVGSVLDRMVWAAFNESAEVPPGSGLLAALVTMGCAVGIGLVTRAEDQPSPMHGSGRSFERSTDR